MKKKIAIIVTVSILALAAIGGGVAYKLTSVPKDMQYKVEEVQAKSDKKIKVGIISDSQLPQVEKHLYGWDYATVMGGGDHLTKALKYFKKQDVDMVVLNGDVVNATGDYAAYSAYNKILDYVYGEDRKDMPHFIYPMGNHEFYGGNQEHQYYKATGLPLNARTIVNGYSFISISNSKLEKGDEELAKSNGTLADGTYNPKRIAFLKEQMAAAAKEDPNKPIFVFLHMPIDNTINGGHWATPQFEEIYNVLKDYPQAVVFTSHSHYCLSDERSIMQKDFTLVNTGTSSYFDFDWIKDEDMPKDISIEDYIAGNHEKLLNKDYLINPQILGIEKTDDVPYRNDVNNGFIMEVDTENNSFKLDKVNFNTGIKFGEEFSMNSFTKNDFTRTKEILGQGKEPFFNNASITAVPDNNNVTVTFDAADQSVPVKYYLLEIENSKGEKTYTRYFGKNYILGANNAYTEQCVLHDLKADDYTVKVYATNSFGLTSKAFLEKSFTVK